MPSAAHISATPPTPTAAVHPVYGPRRDQRPCGDYEYECVAANDAYMPAPALVVEAGVLAEVAMVVVAGEEVVAVGAVDMR
jgi:hypothetical protein